MIAISLLCCSCRGIRITDRNNHSIVLIIDSITPDKSFTYLSGGRVTRNDSVFMRYLDDSSKVVSVRYPRKRRDTITVSSKRKYVEFEYRSRICSRYVLLAVGDTVVVNFGPMKDPVFNSMCNGQLSSAYNFYASLPVRKFNYGLYAPESATSIPVKIAQRIKEHAGKAALYRSALFLEYIDPDTLRQAIEEFFRVYKQNLRLLNADSEYKNWLSYQLEMIGTDVAYDTVNDCLISDLHIQNISYLNFLRNDYYLHYCTSKRIPPPTMINDVYTDPKGHRSHQMLFDTLKQDGMLPPKTKIALLKHAVTLMYKEKYPDRALYEKEYSDLSGEEVIPAPQVRRHVDYGSLHLVDKKGTMQTFAEVLHRNIGHVVVVDFWATTCAPCIQAMSAAKELRHRYRNKKVSFVYISIGEKEDTWRKKESSLIGSPTTYDSFIASNYKESQMIRDLEITEIPRYLIFDRAGNLVDDRAPGPQNPNIYGILDSLLTER